MRKRIWKLLCCFLLMASSALSLAVPVLAETPEKETVFAMSNSVATTDALPCAVALTQPLSSTACALSREELQTLTVCAGGMPFGVKFYMEGVSIVGFCDVETERGTSSPASAAGLRKKDMILKVDGTPLTCANDLTDRIEQSKGRTLRLLCSRAGHEFETTLRPVFCPAENRYKTGIWVRDSGAGIGTVTFVVPDTGMFAGLGHGICDADTGALISMKRGTVSDVTISSVVKGASGAPGELKGYFNAGKAGALLGNSTCGVWGMLSELPENVSEPMHVGLRDEIVEGDAYILCTTDTNKIGKYSIKISNINRDAKGSKCYTVTVTDPNLLAITGGIVQGMSGSPIIQNGKLVGAVTHVLINDPTTGYGIFLENMLVNMPMMAR